MGQILEVTNRDLQVIDYKGQPVKVHKTPAGLILINIRELFSQVFDRNKYSHIKKIVRLGVDAIYQSYDGDEKKDEFISIDKVEAYLLEYRIPASAYEKAVKEGRSTFDDYLEFVKTGGLNQIYKKIMTNTSFGNDMEDREFRVPSVAYLLDRKKELELELKVNEQEDGGASLNEVISVNELSESEEHIKASWMKERMQSVNIFLWSSILLILCLIPFTYMAILQYIVIDGEGWKLYMSYLMAMGLAVSIDWSILVFTLNGKERQATIGSIFQVIFVAVHFDLIGSIVGQSIEEYITKICIVIYSAILLNQYSKLASNAN